MFILIGLTQHVSGIIKPIVRRTDFVKKLRVVDTLLCWLQSCRFGTRAVCTVSQLYTTAANTTRHTSHAVFYIVCSPDDGHNDARIMLS
jgi:hypothetical protein